MRSADTGHLVELTQMSGMQRPVRVRLEPSLPFPVAFTGGAALEKASNAERQGLLNNQGKDDQQFQQNVNTTTSTLSLCLLSALCILMIAAVGLAIAAWTQADEAIKNIPSTQAAIDILQILNNTARLTESLASLSARTDAILIESRPVVKQALNTSSNLLGHLDSFAAHPTVQIG